MVKNKKNKKSYQPKKQMFKRYSPESVDAMSYRQIQLNLTSYKKWGYTDIKLNSKKESLKKELKWLYANIGEKGQTKCGCSVRALALATRTTIPTAFNMMKPYLKQKEIDGKMTWGSSSVPKILEAANRYNLKLQFHSIAKNIKVKDFTSSKRGFLFTNNHVMYYDNNYANNSHLSLEDNVTYFYSIA